MTDLTRLFQIFRAGTHTAMSGQPLTFSEDDLRQIAAAYPWQKAKNSAPLVLGHPADNRPTYGEVNALVVDGGRLFAHAIVSPGLLRAVKAGHYKKVSAAFHSPSARDNPVPGVWSLRHVGFLGAQPPAVKGMAALEFAEHRPGASIQFAEGVDFADEPDTATFSEAEALAARVAFYQAQLPGLPYSEVFQLAALR